ncbi:Chromate transport protein [Paraliobacillus sp. PM-2]|uniref:chromate transporter n=1 Tax=Paraliobacillus sp. PM-2 TaxID=1462524 RepID=UPI00061C732F|nr:chromate transporter [Paraliobacillus sp. PM-2]CQR46380.1 Chromate transport protein [Paraliobacillus sp. PM-2]
MNQWYLFLAFFRVGILGYGGGPSSIPLVQKEVVEKYKWLNNEEFGNILALANALPGPIATKMAGYIGYRVAGVIGMLNAVLATIVPTIFLMIILLTFLSSASDTPWMNGMTKAVLPVVGVMLAVLAFNFLKKAKVDLGWFWMSILAITSFLFTELLGIHPAILILGLLIVALVKPDADKQEESS